MAMAMGTVAAMETGTAVGIVAVMETGTVAAMEMGTAVGTEMGMGRSLRMNFVDPNRKQNERLVSPSQVENDYGIKPRL
jgi:hypothetical protein